MARAVLITILAFCFVCATLPGSAAAARKKTHRKSLSAAKRPAARKSAAKKSAAKTRHGKATGARRSATSHKSSRRRASRAHSGARRRVAVSKPAGQRNPTPERYREIQEALIAKGYLKGPATGQWGSESIEAMKRFQADQKLDADGKIEALTLIALGLGPKNSPIATNSQSPAR